MSLLMFMLLLPSGSSLGCRETSTDSVLPPPSRPRQRNPSSSVRPSRTWSRRSTHEHLAASLTPKLSYTQMIDFNRWAGDWNGEVAKQERDVIAGRLEPVQDPANQINRKAPFDLSHWWTESKKDVNTARTIENNKRQLQAMRERKRIQVEAPATESSAAVGVTCNGVRFSFPFVNNSSATTPRAAPSLAPVDEAPNEQEDVGEDSYMDAGGENGGGVGQGGGVDDGRSSSVASGTAGGVASGGASSAREGTGRVREGDGAYVVPAAACSTLQSVAPTFGTGLGFASAARVWNPQPPAPVPRPRKRARSCRICGHIQAKPRWTRLHTGGGGGGGAKVCSVPENLRRVPDNPHAQRNRFEGPCDCNDCT